MRSQQAAELAGAIQHIREAAYQGKDVVAICMDDSAASFYNIGHSGIARRLTHAPLLR